MGYRFLDHTADLAVEVTAATREELFGEALRALTDSITPVDRIEPRVRRRITLEASALDELLLEWLSEAVARFEIDGLLFRSARVELAESGEILRLTAVAEGEEYDPHRHPLKVLIKAVTYHGLEVERQGPGWRARIIFDI
ncbi:MAG: archease [Thermoanaerobaculia bacterium]